MRILARSLSFAVAAVLLATGLLAAHDMFLRPAQHFVAASSTVLVRLLNGTYSKSENSITRDRLLDIAIVSPAGRAKGDDPTGDRAHDRADADGGDQARPGRGGGDGGGGSQDRVEARPGRLVERRPWGDVMATDNSTEAT